jgi:hypothetical protein
MPGPRNGEQATVLFLTLFFLLCELGVLAVKFPDFFVKDRFGLTQNGLHGRLPA